MFFELLTIGFGGFLGAIARYFIFMADKHFYKTVDFPLGTLAVNVLGSFLIGVALGMSLKYGLLNRGSLSHFLFVTGFLGAFTTFSTFSQDSLILFLDRQYEALAISIFSNLFLGFLFVALGYFLVLKLK